ncbi:hypothetical protein WA841_33650, partial [Pseudomonas aeruginosa]
PRAVEDVELRPGALFFAVRKWGGMPKAVAALVVVMLSVIWQALGAGGEDVVLAAHAEASQGG